MKICAYSFLAISSAVELFVYTEKVKGSNPLLPKIFHIYDF